MISLSYFSSVKLFSGLFLYEMSISGNLLIFSEVKYLGQNCFCLISHSHVFSLSYFFRFSYMFW